MPLSSALLFTEDLLMTYLARACTQELILEGGLGSYDVPGAVSIIGPVNATIEFLTFQDIVTNLGSGLFVGAGAVGALYEKFPNVQVLDSHFRHNGHGVSVFGGAAAITAGFAEFRRCGFMKNEVRRLLPAVSEKMRH